MLACKGSALCDSEKLVAFANHDFGFERQETSQFCAELRLADGGANDERTRGADVDDIEALESLRDDGGTKRSVPADVHAFEKDDVRHDRGHFAGILGPPARDRTAVLDVQESER
jgi:hypothetical protein